MFKKLITLEIQALGLKDKQDILAVPNAVIQLGYAYCPNHFILQDDLDPGNDFVFDTWNILTKWHNDNHCVLQLSAETDTLVRT